MKPDLRKRIFSLQQRVAITSGEALALLAFVAMMAVGGVAAHLQGQRLGVDTSAYAELDAAIEAGASLDVEEALVGTAVEQEPAQVRVAREPVRQRRPVRLAPIRLDPNTASSQALQRLPGIGPAIAGRIIEYRELHGPFDRPADLMSVRGIGPKTFERLEPYLYVEAPEPQAETRSDYWPGEPGAESSASSEAPSPDTGGR